MTIRSSAASRSLVFAFSIALGACGSSSSTGGGGASGHLGGSTGTSGGKSGSAGGTTGAAGGSTGAVGGTTGAAGGSTGTVGGGGATGACSQVPACLTDLTTNCVPGGTCMSQRTGTVLTGDLVSASCYSNGVKEAVSSAIDFTTSAVTTTFKLSKNGVTCFSYEISQGAGGAGGAGSLTTPPITIKNGAGVAVATLMTTDTGTTTVTCGGKTYDITNAGDCTGMGAGGASGTGITCTPGVCAP